MNNTQSKNWPVDSKALWENLTDGVACEGSRGLGLRRIYPAQNYGYFNAFDEESVLYEQAEGSFNKQDVGATCWGLDYDDTTCTFLFSGGSHENLEYVVKDPVGFRARFGTPPPPESVPESGLSIREQWLIIEGFLGGYAKGVDDQSQPYNRCIRDKARDWLNYSVADGVTVEMLLNTDAPDTDMESNDGQEETVDLLAIIKQLRARAQNSSCTYISLCRERGCVGWRLKIETNQFGEAELKAHEAAARELGRYHALHEVADLLAEQLKQ